MTLPGYRIHDIYLCIMPSSLPFILMTHSSINPCSPLQLTNDGFPGISLLTTVHTFAAPHKLPSVDEE